MNYLNINRFPDILRIKTEDLWVRLDTNDYEAWYGKGIDVLLKHNNNELKVLLASESQPVSYVHLRWNLTVSGGIRFLGDHWERAYGDLEWKGIVPERVMPWYFLVNDGPFTHGYGVKTGSNSMCFWQVDNAGVSLYLDVRCGNTGVLLGGRTLDAATIITCMGIEGESAFEAARKFCALMCDNPVLPEFPVYGGNNWYYAYGESSHEEILNDSKLIASLADSQENRPFMVIDDGWQLSCDGGNCNGGPWNIGNYKFPDMQRLAGEMKDIGVRPGIWMRPLLEGQKVPDSWRRYALRGNVLDPSIPDVLEKIHKDVSGLAAWGYELIKHDFSTFEIFGKWGFEMGAKLSDFEYGFADRSKTTAEIILNFYKTIADAAAGKAVIIGCNTISHLSAGIFHIQRTGDDTSGLEWSRTRKMGINTLAYRMPQHGTFYSSDADCIGITDKIEWNLNRQWLELLAESGTPLFVSAAPSAVGEEQRRALRKAFEKASKPMTVGEPLDWLETTYPTKWKLNGRLVEFNWYEEEGVKFF